MQIKVTWWVVVLFILTRQGEKFVIGDAELWKCGDGLSIDLSWKCDGLADCEDGSDEWMENCKKRECAYDEFRCESGSCISHGLVCNGDVDCSIGGNEDDSDETFHCAALQNLSCPFQTSHLCNSGICIPLDWVCDNTDDCFDNSDEEHCPKHDGCPIGHVKCNTSSECIEKIWICDGDPDCDDGEDEIDCQFSVAHSKPRIQRCGLDSFACAETCMLIPKACDGITDCPNGEDEGDFCQLNSCRVRNDPAVWDDENGPPSCDHACRQTPQGPMCHCLPGYALEPDGYRCRTEGTNPPSILYAADNKIRRLVLHATAPWEEEEYTDYKEPDAKIISLDYDGQSDTLIWIEERSNTVQIRDSLMHKEKLLKVLRTLTDLALDWITKNIYVTLVPKQSEKNVGVFSLRSNERRKYDGLYFLKIRLVKPLSLVLLSHKRKMILLDQGKDRTSSRLLLASMDGRNATVLATRPHIISVTADCVTDIIYWSEANEHEAKILMMKMDGSAKRVLISSIDHDILFTVPISMTVFEDKLYFGDNVTREIWSLDSLSGKPSKFASSRPVPLYKNIKLYRLHDIQVYHPVLQKTNLESPCDSSECSHLCILRPGGVRCLCPEGMFLVGETACIEIYMETTKYTQATSTASTWTSSVSKSTMGASSSLLPTSADITSTLPSTSSKLSTANNDITSTPPSTSLKLSTVKNFKTFMSSSTTTDRSMTRKPNSMSTLFKTILLPNIARVSTILTPTSTAVSSTATSTNSATTSDRFIQPTTTKKSVPIFFSTPTPAFKTSAVALDISSKSVAMSSKTTSAAKYSTTTGYSSTAFTSISTASVDTFTLSSSSSTILKTIVFCPKPTTSRGSKIINNDSKYEIGAEIVYSCKKGWHIQGSSQRDLTLTCGRTGKWTASTSPVCEENTCSDVDCGDGNCVVMPGKGPACRCLNGTISVFSCSLKPATFRLVSTTTVSTPIRSNSPSPGVVFSAILVALLLLGTCVFVYKRYRRKSHYSYSLVNEEESSPLNSRKEGISNTNDHPNKRSQTTEFIIQSDNKGFHNPNYVSTTNIVEDFKMTPKKQSDEEGVSNPNYSPPKQRKLLPLPEEIDSGVDQSGSSLESPGGDLKTAEKEECCDINSGCPTFRRS